MTDTKQTVKWLLIFIGVAALVIGAAVLIAKFMQGVFKLVKKIDELMAAENIFKHQQNQDRFGYIGKDEYLGKRYFEHQ